MLIKHSIRARKIGPRSQLKVVRGFAMIELILAISITAILAIYANQQISNQSQENIARGAGIYLKIVADSVQRHILINFSELGAGTPVAGTANPLKPTIAELKALNRLNSGFPEGMPTRQIARIDIVRTGCPGVSCQVTSTVCTTTPVRTMGTGATRFDLAYAMLDEQTGSGGQSRQGDGANIRGPALNVPNPLGNVEGIVCGSSFVDVGMFDAFVRVRDTRDPDLRGDLTVAGATTLNGPTNVNNTLNVTGATTLQNNLTVNGSLTVGPCISLVGGPKGRAGFGCANADDVPAGYVGGVRSADVVASGSLLASENPGAFTGANGNYALVTANNGTGVSEIRTSGRSAGDRLTPLGSYAPGAVCVAADEGSIAKNSTASGLVTCESGIWVSMKKTGVVDQPCSPDGAIGTSPGGLALYCQSGIWTLLADRFGRFAIVDTYLVYDHSRGLNPVIPIPVCPASGYPKIYFNPQGVDARSGSKANFRADITTSPGNYTIHVDDTVNPTDPYGVPTAGYGLLTVGCFYD